MSKVAFPVTVDLRSAGKIEGSNPYCCRLGARGSCYTCADRKANPNSRKTQLMARSLLDSRQKAAELAVHMLAYTNTNLPEQAVSR